MIHWDPANPEAALHHHRAAAARAVTWNMALARTVAAIRSLLRPTRPLLRPVAAGRSVRRGTPGRGSLAGPCPGG